MVRASQIFYAALMAMNSWFSITKSDAHSSTNTALDLLDDFFLLMQKQSTKNKWRRRSDDGGNGGSGALGARVSQRIKARRQKQGKKEEEEMPLNRFTAVKTWPTRPA
jgi:hypothetical protein